MFYVQQRGGRSVIEVRDDLDMLSSPALEASIILADESAESGRIIVSLAECPYCDSTGLSVLIRAKKRLGSRLAIVVTPGGHLTRLLEVSGLRETLVPHDSVDAALDDRLEVD